MDLFVKCFDTRIFLKKKLFGIYVIELFPLEKRSRDIDFFHDNNSFTAPTHAVVLLKSKSFTYRTKHFNKVTIIYLSRNTVDKMW